MWYLKYKYKHSDCIYADKLREFELDGYFFHLGEYVKGNYVYQANYTGGLRILSLDAINDGELKEVAYFDTYPENNITDLNGAWSNYPYFESGIIVVSDISNGLFILKPNLP